MEEHSFDALAKEMADATISRGQALKVAGVAILGAFGLASLPGLAEAKKKKKKKKKPRRGATIVTPPTPPPPCAFGDPGCPTFCTCQGQCIESVCQPVGGSPPPGTLPPCSLLAPCPSTTCNCQGLCALGLCVSLGGGGGLPGGGGGLPLP